MPETALVPTESATIRPWKGDEGLKPGEVTLIPASRVGRFGVADEAADGVFCAIGVLPGLVTEC